MSLPETLLAPWWQRLDAAARTLDARIDWPRERLFDRDLVLAPPGTTSPNRHCHLHQTADRWIALNLAREDDASLLPALFEREIKDGNIARLFATRPAAHWRARAALLGLPLGIIGEAEGGEPGLLHAAAHGAKPRLSDVRVLDLSALWAGPLCGALLAAGGAQVTKLEDPRRPDPTAEATPLLDLRLNGGKHARQETLTAPLLNALLAESDVLITSARPAALARLGIDPDKVFDTHPRLLWVAITAYGWAGEAGRRVGFGDDCAAAGGLVEWRDGAPHFAGDALADPLTGLVAAVGALEALAAGRGGLLDCALAPTAALFAADL